MGDSPLDPGTVYDDVEIDDHAEPDDANADHDDEVDA